MLQSNRGGGRLGGEKGQRGQREGQSMPVFLRHVASPSMCIVMSVDLMFCVFLLTFSVFLL